MFSENSRLLRILAIAVALLLAAAIVFAPAEDSAALLVAIVCTAIGLAALTLTHRGPERTVVLRLFLIALVLRLVFAYGAYKTGLADVLGGADDTGWKASWVHSRYWAGWFGNTHYTQIALEKKDFPDTFLDLFRGSTQRNLGYHLFGTYFFYWLDERSQMALAFVNCLASALTAVLIFKIARRHCSERASAFAAWAAILLPGFLAWSALTIKESWVILLEVATFYTVGEAIRRRSPGYAILTLALIALVQSLRFYVAYVLVAACLVMWFTAGARQPFRAAVKAVAGVAVLFLALNAVGVIHADPTSVLVNQWQDINTFRSGVAGSRFGGSSSVQLNYDVTQPAGAAMMIVTGAAYLLLSPFPWQFHSARELLSLPDVLAWWWLVFFFIVPGIRAAWRRHAHLLLSAGAFVLPLVLFYSLLFGNVGLAFRQRAQLMPFFLVLAAVGYEARQRRLQPAMGRTQLATQLLRQLHATPGPTNPAPAPTATSAPVP